MQQEVRRGFELDTVGGMGNVYGVNMDETRAPGIEMMNWQALRHDMSGNKLSIS